MSTNQCKHTQVTIHSRLFAMETRDQPAEYEHKAHCDQCGEWMDVEDVPDEDEDRDVNNEDDGYPEDWEDGL